MKDKLCKCHRLRSQCKCPKPGETPIVEMRENSARRGYGRKWREFREMLWKRMIASGTFPKCAMCGQSLGLESPHFDHIQPVTDANDPRFYDPTNIQFLHPGCHAKKTNRDVRNGKTRTNARAKRFAISQGNLSQR